MNRSSRFPQGRRRAANASTESRARAYFRLGGIVGPRCLQFPPPRAIWLIAVLRGWSELVGGGVRWWLRTDVLKKYCLRQWRLVGGSAWVTQLVPAQPLRHNDGDTPPEWPQARLLRFSVMFQGEKQSENFY